MNSAVLRLVRGLGWLLIAAGTMVLLYLVYSLFFTGVTTQRAQSELSDQWRLEVGEVQGRLASQTQQDSSLPVADVDPGTAVAVLQFRRPDSDVIPVHADALFVVEGVGVEQLMLGPGRYPGTAMPGQQGNFAIAGHRTTYANPFFHLDAIRPGDEIHVTDRAGDRYVYTVVKQQVVGPGDTWVIGPDPLDTGRPTLTLTTCHPRFSNVERLIVFAEMA